ncbi:MAG: phage major capsid protein [Desulfovibrio sp.]
MAKDVNEQRSYQMRGKVVQRSMQMDVRGVDEEKRTLELAFSSDAEVERWPGFIEVLDHSSGAVRMERLLTGAPLLFNHDRDKHIGTVESARIDADGKGRATVRFGSGKLATEKFNDARDGILTQVSVGYTIIEIKFVESREGGDDVYRVTDWEPYEISLVTMPADTSVGVGRSLDDSGGILNVNPEEADMPKPEDGRSDNKATPKPVDVAAERAAAVEAEQARTTELLKMGRTYNAPDLAARFIEEGKSADDFARSLLAEQDTNKATPAQRNESVGLSEREIANYSFLKVLRTLNPNDTSARKAAAFELEVSEAAARQAERQGREISGVVIPPEVLAAPVRTVYTTDGSAAPHGAATVSTDLLASSFIEMLRKKALLLQYGTRLGGLVGNILIPKQIGGATAAIIGEDEPAPETNGDFGQIGLNPFTLAAKSMISRRLLMQSSLDVEALVRSDLATAIALKMDYTGFYGTGVDEPCGIIHSAGVNAVAFAAAGKPTYSELVQMETEISSDDADLESMRYFMNARGRGHCKTTARFSNTESPIWEKGNTVNGYATAVTNQVKDGDIVFGNFADLIVGLWGGLELTLDPYSASDKGQLKIVAMQDFDLAIRNVESFCVGKAA